MKTMMKLGLAMIVFGVVLAILGSVAIRAQGEAKVTNKGSESTASSVSKASASASASVAAPVQPKK